MKYWFVVAIALLFSIQLPLSSMDFETSMDLKPDHIHELCKLLTSIATFTYDQPRTTAPVPSLKELAVDWLNANGHTITKPHDLSRQSVAHLSRYVMTCSPEQKIALFSEILDAPGGDPAYQHWKRYILAALIHAGTNPNTKDFINKTFLYQATLHEDDEATQLLLSYGANPNAATHAIDRPIQHVKKTNIAQLFFDHGQDIAAFESVMPHLARHDYDPELIPLYKKYGANLRLKRGKSTLLHLLVESADWYFHSTEQLITKGRYLLNEAPDLLTAVDYHHKTAAQLCFAALQCPYKINKENYKALLALFGEYNPNAPTQPIIWKLARDYCSGPIPSHINIYHHDEKRWNIVHYMCNSVYNCHPEHLPTLLRRLTNILEIAPDLLTFKPLGKPNCVGEYNYAESALEMSKRLLQEESAFEINIRFLTEEQIRRLGLTRPAKKNGKELLKLLEQYEAKALQTKNPSITQTQV